MTEWLVRLDGSAVDLQELADEFQSSELKVSKEGDEYYLRAPKTFPFPAGGLPPSDRGYVAPSRPIPRGVILYAKP